MSSATRPWARGAALACVLALVGLAFLASSDSAHAATNGTIIFRSLRDGNWEIYALTAGGATNLTNNPAAELAPTWSPDGTKIAFETTRDGNLELYVMDVDGGNPTNVTNHTGLDITPTWSPDGSKIAFTSARDGNYEIYVMNADGTGVVRLTFDAGADEKPAWSPDGTRIAFHSDRDGDAEIYVMNADGTAVTQRTANAAFDGHPAWSPDSAKIAFLTDRDGNGEVYVINADGTSPTNLTSNAAPDGVPDWSPDGSTIAFESRRDGNWEIYVMGASGASPTRLTTHPATDSAPDWQPRIDSDLDGCTDDREVQSTVGSETSGGRRDRFNFWDFFDVPDQAGVRDHAISLVTDVFGVALRFGANDDGGAAAINRSSDPLSAPPSPPAYHPAFDRGALEGANPWDLSPPNGQIDLVTDVLGVASQFGHSCQ